MFNFLKNIFGNKHEKDVKLYSEVVKQTNLFYDSYQGLSNDALRNKTLEFRQRIKESLTDIDADIEALTSKVRRILHKKKSYSTK